MRHIRNPCQTKQLLIKPLFNIILFSLLLRIKIMMVHRIICEWVNGFLRGPGAKVQCFSVRDKELLLLFEFSKKLRRNLWWGVAGDKQLHNSPVHLGNQGQPYR